MKLSWSPLQPGAQFFCCASLLETMTVLFFAFHTDDPRQRFSDGSLVTRTLIPGSRLIWILTSSEDLRSCSSIYLKQFKKECKWVWMFFFELIRWSSWSSCVFGNRQQVAAAEESNCLGWLKGTPTGNLSWTSQTKVALQ